MPCDHVVLAANYFVSSWLLEETNGQGFDYNEWSQKNELRKFEFLPVLPLVMCLALKAQFDKTEHLFLWSWMNMSIVFMCLTILKIFLTFYFFSNFIANHFIQLLHLSFRYSTVFILFETVTSFYNQMTWGKYLTSYDAYCGLNVCVSTKFICRNPRFQQMNGFHSYEFQNSYVIRRWGLLEYD